MTSIDDYITLALQEDIGAGDHTSLASVPDDARGKAHLLVKEPGVVAGVEIAVRVLNKVDTGIRCFPKIADGTSVTPGDIVFEIEGNAQSILKAERLLLNIMQRMSGIATLTRKFTDACSGTGAKILDTRKTTPNFRVFEKKAVEIGGGVNHRFGLYDYIMIKDNHIDYAGGIQAALERTRNYCAKNNLKLGIEIEARDMNEVREILKSDIAHRIMLDNFSFAQTREAVQLIDGKFETESSGNITLDTVRSYAECGVDYISSGALTHSVSSLDLSLKAS